ncbi:hypothetical protein E2C01_073500 [Portunus trituberculatus]|uniref:Uncharacterized protein n=1 Tax=Portunus trituberculatus TaxID=210409 RepID=A0A5B7IAQ3_PORTR|nr:hypothetical protein [Portunus trituberculatus]
MWTTAPPPSPTTPSRLHSHPSPLTLMALQTGGGGLVRVLAGKGGVKGAKKDHAVSLQKVSIATSRKDEAPLAKQSRPSFGCHWSFILATF